MNYVVLWREAAERDLIAILDRSADKAGMFFIARQIERRLMRRPRSAGESRGANVRIAFRRPLSVLFTVERPNRTVYVERVQWVGV